MRIGISLIVLFCLVVNITYAQSDESYDFRPVRELEPYKGLPDPFLKPNGKRVKTKAEWLKSTGIILFQCLNIISMEKCHLF